MRRNAFIAFWVDFYHDEDGQSISEYAAALAFVAVLIAMAFNLAQGSLCSQITGTYSVTSQNLGDLNSYANSSTS
jgi:Flp pilus assembly pilin Flp